jgi:DNA-binding response OmpR family regulator
MDGEDEEMIRDVAGEILNRKGYEVELARDNTSSFQIRIIVNRRCP